MSFFSNFFNVKESPILSLTGFGGGGTGISLGGAAGAASGPFTVTGGDAVLTPGNGNKYHVFVSSGSLVVAPGPGMNGTINALILAGGGSGGKSGPSYAGSAGGGAGGAIYLSSYQIYGASGGPVSYPVTVGPGAAAQTSDEQRGTNGSDSVIDFSPFSDGPSTAQIALTAKGGGGGATSGSGTPGSALAGGNGGGGAQTNQGGGLTAPPNSPVYPQCPGTVTLYGNAGHTGTSIYGSGGGGSGNGGAGEAPSADGTNSGGDGGAGVAIPAYPGPLIGPGIPVSERPDFQNQVGPTGLYGGGGGGANYRMNHGSQGSGGPGGGANANNNGYIYTGGGGGGGYASPTNGDGGAGGKGLVIVSYAIS